MAIQVVCIYVTENSNTPHIPGDPLMGPMVRPPRPAPIQDETAGRRKGSAGGRQAIRPHRESGIVTRLVKPEIRLALSLVAVLTATIVLGHGGANADESATISSPANSVAVPDNSTPVVVSKLKVIVSDPANTAIVREVAGTLVQVDSVVPPGGNGHTYEPVPGDAIKVVEADLFFEIGLDLNPAVSNFVKANSKPGLVTVTLADAIPSNEVISTDSAEEIASHGHAHAFNAHLWTDPVYVIAYVNKIKTALVSLDSPNSLIYEDRANKFIARLQRLDSVFRTAINSIPVPNKKLVVYHDSWSYFGRRYGISIIGAIQPVSFSEPSADEVRRMVDQIRRENVPAFFGSEVFPSDVLETIASETGSRYFADLSDEELPGNPGTAEHSYEGMMIANVRLITSALGGDVSIFNSVQPGVNPS